jgi:hypothetical protein
MPIFEHKAVAFILRFWLEGREIDSQTPVWRGDLEHVPSGERIYFNELEQLPTILIQYLDARDMSAPGNDST